MYRILYNAQSFLFFYYHEAFMSDSRSSLTISLEKKAELLIEGLAKYGIYLYEPRINDGVLIGTIEKTQLYCLEQMGLHEFECNGVKLPKNSVRDGGWTGCRNNVTTLVEIRLNENSLASNPILTSTISTFFSTQRSAETKNDDQKLVFILKMQIIESLQARLKPIMSGGPSSSRWSILDDGLLNFEAGSQDNETFYLYFLTKNVETDMPLKTHEAVLMYQNPDVRPQDDELDNKKIHINIRAGKVVCYGKYQDKAYEVELDLDDTNVNDIRNVLENKGELNYEQKNRISDGIQASGKDEPLTFGLPLGSKSYMGYYKSTITAAEFDKINEAVRETVEEKGVPSGEVIKKRHPVLTRTEVMQGLGCGFSYDTVDNIAHRQIYVNLHEVVNRMLGLREEGKAKIIMENVPVKELRDIMMAYRGSTGR